MKVGLDKRSFWSKSFVPFCPAGRMRYDPAVTRAQLAGRTVATDVPPLAPPPRRRSVGRESEPLLVELAWLVIEGAVLFRRLRGILARN